MAKSEATVLIVGAGPTGLTLALDLIQRGIAVRIIDQAAGPSIHSKALGIQSRTLEVFEKMGILDDFLQKGSQLRDATYHWKKKKFDLHLELEDAPHPFILILPQRETELILLKHLQNAGCSVEWQTTLLDIIGEKALIEHQSGSKEVCSNDWIIGCDGAHSRVRHVLKLPFKGMRFPEHFLLADIRASSPIPVHAHFFLSSKGAGILLPFSKENYRLIFPLKKELPTRIDEEVLMKLLRERGFQDIMDIHSIDWVSHFQVHRKMTTTLKKNNILLVGDAAHIHSPAGGQGMNTSIQDAFNLGWKLDLVIQNAPFNSLIDSYEKERLDVAKSVLKETTFLTRIVLLSQKCSYLAFIFFKLLSSNKKMRLKMARSLSELNLKYTESTIIKGMKRDKEWSGPKPGERAPDANLKDGTRLFEKMKTKNHVLLLFAKHEGLISAIQQEYGKWIDILVVLEEEVQKKYAAGTDSIYLIRPDGYIGYRNKSFKLEEVVSYLLTIFKPVSQRNK